MFHTARNAVHVQYVKTVQKYVTAVADSASDSRAFSATLLDTI